MNEVISKELVSEVLEVNGVLGLEQNQKDIVIIFGEGCKFNINIHELAHRCKEWARTEGKEYLYTQHIIGTNYPSSSGEKPEVKHYDMWVCFVNIIQQHRIGTADTEPEAIFKACEYII